VGRVMGCTTAEMDGDDGVCVHTHCERSRRQSERLVFLTLKLQGLKWSGDCGGRMRTGLRRQYRVLKIDVGILGEESFDGGSTAMSRGLTKSVPAALRHGWEGGIAGWRWGARRCMVAADMIVEMSVGAQASEGLRTMASYIQKGAGKSGRRSHHRGQDGR
jgi:hypothetical protein